MFLLNNSPLALDTPFEHNGTSYPANWLRLTTLAEKIAIGITEVADPAVYDDRYYWGVDNPKALEDKEEVDQEGNPMFVMVLGEVDGEPAMVPSAERLVTKGLKSQMVAQVKATAGSLLAQTDWYVTRKFERGVEIPAKVAEKRAAVVTESERLEAAIIACSDVPALISVMNAQNWGE
jgi:hypothetical protein